MAKTLACRAGVPGSIPGRGVVPFWHLRGFLIFVLILSITHLTNIYEDSSEIRSPYYKEKYLNWKSSINGGIPDISKRNFELILNLTELRRISSNRVKSL